jgi:hypothetical protein
MGGKQGDGKTFFNGKDMLGKHWGDKNIRKMSKKMLGKYWRTLGIIKKRPRNTMKKLIMIKGHQVMIGHQKNA